MHYTVYKITNKVNGKYYIGKHQTEDLNDDYFGSGKLLKRAIDKHGIQNFSKEILHTFDNEQDMNAKEAELVVVDENTYNICPGGHGGFGYLNNHPDKKKWVVKGRIKANKVLGPKIHQRTKKAYLENPNHCLQCDEVIPYKKYNKKFCNHSCSATYNNRHNHWRHKLG